MDERSLQTMRRRSFDSLWRKIQKCAPRGIVSFDNVQSCMHSIEPTINYQLSFEETQRKVQTVRYAVLSIGSGNVWFAMRMTIVGTTIALLLLLLLLGYTTALETEWNHHHHSYSSLYVSESDTEERILRAMVEPFAEQEYSESLYGTDESASSRPLSVSILASDTEEKESSDKEEPAVVDPKETIAARPETATAPLPNLTAVKEEQVKYVPLPELDDSTAKEKLSLSSITSPWVRNFLKLHPRDILLPLPKDYCADAFNLAHMPTVIEKITGNAALYKPALQLLTESEPSDTSPPTNDIHEAAAILYYHLHQRYAVSPRGLDMVRRRFLSKTDPIFGRCPQLSCRGMPLLPIGEFDSYTDHRSLCRRYCVNCKSVFYHWDSTVDGCAWGTSFCHLFLMVHGAQVFHWTRPTHSQKQQRYQEQRLTPRIFGFRLHHTAIQ